MAFPKHFRRLGDVPNDHEVSDLRGWAQLPGTGFVRRGQPDPAQVRELEGAFVRGISVFKARVFCHEPTVRRVTIDANGIGIGAAFQGLQGVLTGLPYPRPRA